MRKLCNSVNGREFARSHRLPRVDRGHGYGEPQGRTTQESAECVPSGDSGLRSGAAPFFVLAYCAEYPPSTIHTAPFTKEASSEARKAITLAISSAVPMRPAG